MAKYIIGEVFISGGATLCKNPSDQTVYEYEYDYAVIILSGAVSLNLDSIHVWRIFYHEVDFQ